MKKLMEDDPRFKFYEMTFFCMALAILVLLCITVFFLTKQPVNNCDVNGDGEINALDLLIVQKEIVERNGM